MFTAGIDPAWPICLFHSSDFVAQPDGAPHSSKQCRADQVAWVWIHKKWLVEYARPAAAAEA